MTAFTAQLLASTSPHAIALGRDIALEQFWGGKIGIGARRRHG